MTNGKNPKKFDLEERTMIFAARVREFVRSLPRTLSNIEDSKQLIRSSGSVGANFIEASESLSKKDFLMRVKISRKEAKESQYWLKLLYIGENQSLETSRSLLIQEALELTKIFGSIVTKQKTG